MIKLIELIKLMTPTSKIQVLDKDTWEDYFYGGVNKIIDGYENNSDTRAYLDSFIPVRVYGNSIYVYKDTLSDPHKKPKNDAVMQVEIIYTNGVKAVIENVVEVKLGDAGDLLFAHEIMEHKLLATSGVVFIQKPDNEPNEIIKLKCVDIIKTRIGQQ